MIIILPSCGTAICSMWKRILVWSILFLFSFGTSTCHKHHLVKRVVGGREIPDAARWPWLVSLHGNIPTFRIFGWTITSQRVTCGGALLSNRWVLTAAHCLMRPHLSLWSQVPQFWTARMGDINLHSDLSKDIVDLFAEAFDIDNAKDWDIDGDEIHIHPQYQPAKNWESDIALVRLTRDAPVTGYRVPSVDSISINTDPNFPHDGANCTFKGWGCKEFGGSLENVARQVELLKLSDSVCQQRWKVNINKKICAGDADTGICQGDSGGPLVCVKGNQWVLVGVASFTSSYEGFPGVFARVSAHSNWIRDTINKNS